MLVCLSTWPPFLRGVHVICRIRGGSPRKEKEFRWNWNGVLGLLDWKSEISTPAHSSAPRAKRVRREIPRAGVDAMLADFQILMRVLQQQYIVHRYCSFCATEPPTAGGVGIIFVENSGLAWSCLHAESMTFLHSRLVARMYIATYPPTLGTRRSL